MKRRAGWAALAALLLVAGIHDQVVDQDRTFEEALDRLAERRPDDPDVRLCRATSAADLEGRDDRPVALAQNAGHQVQARDWAALGRTVERWKAIEPDNALPWILAAQVRWTGGELEGCVREFQEGVGRARYDNHAVDHVVIAYRLALEGGVVRPAEICGALTVWPGVAVVLPVARVLDAILALADAYRLRGDPRGIETLRVAQAFVRLFDQPVDLRAGNFLVIDAFLWKLARRLAPELLALGRFGEARAILDRYRSVRQASKRVGSLMMDGTGPFPFDQPFDGSWPARLDEHPLAAREYLGRVVSGEEFEWLLAHAGPAPPDPDAEWTDRLWEARGALAAAWSGERADALADCVAGDCYVLQREAAYLLSRAPEALQSRALVRLLWARGEVPRWIPAVLGAGEVGDPTMYPIEAGFVLERSGDEVAIAEALELLDDFGRGEQEWGVAAWFLRHRRRG